MPKTLTQIQIFVSCPSDLEPEVEILESLVDEINRILENVFFHIVHWKTHVRPGVGSDPQAVINSQMPQDYDVFIGLLWSRFGTKTPRASSGTYEEFEAAIARNKETGGVPEVMFYFKDAPLPPSSINGVDLQKIHDFKNSLSGLGALYGSFSDDTSFQSTLRSHLVAVAKKFNAPGDSRIAKTAIVEPSVPGSNIETMELEELGYLDYFEIFEEKNKDFVRALSDINELTIKLNQNIQARTQELVEANLIDAGVQERKRLIKRAAGDMDSFASSIKLHVSQLSAAREITLNAISHALALQQDFTADDEGFASLGLTLHGMYESILGAKDSTSRLQAAAAGLPRLTSDLNRAKRAVVLALEPLIIELDDAAKTTISIASAVDRLKGLSNTAIVSSVTP